MNKYICSALLATLLIVACHQPTSVLEKNISTQNNAIEQSYIIEKIKEFNEPWAIKFLPDQRLLITEKAGKLKIFDPSSKEIVEVLGVPAVAYGGQGGLGDVVLHPKFAENSWIYLSYVEAGQGGYGAVIVRAQLDLNTQPITLSNLKKIWHQFLKVEGQGHYSHRMLFDAEGKLWVTSGERQKFYPAQDIHSNLGKVLRLNDDGRPVADNPFVAQKGVAAEIWSLGHRNSLAIAFDANQQLWVTEMGPKGGDELNRIEKAANYGYPIVSNGDHYDNSPIPDHATRPDFKAPVLDWTPVISPSSMLFYQGSMFPRWKNKAIISGLSSQAMIIVDTQSQPVREVQRIDMGQRIRGLAEAKDGSIWVIEDGERVNLLRLAAE